MVKGICLGADLRDLIPLHLFGLQGPGCQIGDLLLQYLPIPGDRAVAAQHPGQPQQVVRDAGPYLSLIHILFSSITKEEAEDLIGRWVTEERAALSVVRPREGGQA